MFCRSGPSSRLFAYGAIPTELTGIWRLDRPATATLRAALVSGNAAVAPKYKLAPIQLFHLRLAACSLQDCEHKVISFSQKSCQEAFQDRSCFRYLSITPETRMLASFCANSLKDVRRTVLPTAATNCWDKQPGANPSFCLQG